MNDANEVCVTLSKQALQRMPYYLQYLKKLRTNGTDVVAAHEVAKKLRLNEVQVRKDFAAISTTKGKPKVGFTVADLIYNMEDALGYHNTDDAVLVGTGSLGKALLSYNGFDERGMRIVMGFDIDPSVTNQEIGGKPILSLELLKETCQNLNIRIGIITVPADQAQAVCDLFVESGILAVWNFAPIHLSAPDNILVKNENMAASLAFLSKHLRDKYKEKCFE